MKKNWLAKTPVLMQKWHTPVIVNSGVPENPGFLENDVAKHYMQSDILLTNLYDLDLQALYTCVCN